MRKFAPVGLLILGLLALFVFWRRPAVSHAIVVQRPVETGAIAPTRRGVDDLARAHPPPLPPSPFAPPTPPALSAEEKARRVEKVDRDYAAMRLAAVRDYGEAGEAFPGGSHTLQRQLALLEREKRADLAAVLDPLELEDLELRETGAGQRIAFRLGTTAATEAQRRAVFRLQREFDLRFAGVTQTTPEVLSEREKAQQELQQRIRGVLGETLFEA